MPKIGRINVPNTLWEAMVEQSAKVTVNNDLESVRENAGITEEEMDKALAQLGIQDSDTFGVHCNNCVIALVRMQTNDFLSDDETIRQGSDFRLIRDEIAQQAIQTVQNILSSDKQITAIKALLYRDPRTVISRNSSPSP